jgi:hypothetical protein
LIQHRRKKEKRKRKMKSYRRILSRFVDNSTTAPFLAQHIVVAKADRLKLIQVAVICLVAIKIVEIPDDFQIWGAADNRYSHFVTWAIKP